MTKEELLLPRYKVIAIWPGMHLEPFRLHQIVTLQPHKEEDAEGFIYIPYVHKPSHFMWQSFFTLFPHLFKKIDWWEERNMDDMPEFVKGEEGVYKATWKPGIPLLMTIDGQDWHVVRDVMCFFEPASKEEYEAYQKTITWNL